MDDIHTDPYFRPDGDDWVIAEWTPLGNVVSGTTVFWKQDIPALIEWLQNGPPTLLSQDEMT